MSYLFRLGAASPRSNGPKILTRFLDWLSHIDHKQTPSKSSGLDVLLQDPVHRTRATLGPAARYLASFVEYPFRAPPHHDQPRSDGPASRRFPGPLRVAAALTRWHLQHDRQHTATVPGLIGAASGCVTKHYRARSARQVPGCNAPSEPTPARERPELMRRGFGCSTAGDRRTGILTSEQHPPSAGKVSAGSIPHDICSYAPDYSIDQSTTQQASVSRSVASLQS